LISRPQRGEGGISKEATKGEYTRFTIRKRFWVGSETKKGIRGARRKYSIKGAAGTCRRENPQYLALETH